MLRSWNMCVLGRSNQLISVERCVFFQSLISFGAEVSSLQSLGAGSTPRLDSNLESPRQGGREGWRGLGAWGNFLLWESGTEVVWRWVSLIPSEGQRSVSGHSFGRECKENSGFPDGSSGKGSACNAGDSGSTPGTGRSPAEGNGNPLQYFCLRNPVARGVWWATVHTVTKESDTAEHTRQTDISFYRPGRKMWETTDPTSASAGQRFKMHVTSLVVQGLRVQAPSAGGPGSNLGPHQGTRPHMPQLRPNGSQINKNIF